MIGAIFGDIAGSKYEFHNIKTKDFSLLTPDCTFTDDSVCTIAFIDWLLNAAERNEKTATKYLHKWTRKYPYAGYGGRFRYWVFSNNPKPYNSFGNGSAMRVSAVAWAAKDLDDLKYLSDTVTKITHNHPEGMKGAEVTAQLITYARFGKTKEELKEYAEQFYDLDFDYESLKKNYEFNETCQNTVPQAIYCFLISKDFEDCLRTSVSIGGDTDTLCAISCAIAEAYYKYIPESLVEAVRNKLTPEMLKVIDDFDQRFCR